MWQSPSAVLPESQLSRHCLDNLLYSPSFWSQTGIGSHTSYPPLENATNMCRPGPIRHCAIAAESHGRLDSLGQPTNNGGMEIPGRVHNGVVVLQGGPALPEGAAVTVCYPVPVAAHAPTWDDFFATKLAIGSAPPKPEQESLELSGDDLLF
jgi:hypothetical protein